MEIKFLNYDSANLEQVKLIKDLLLDEYALDMTGPTVNNVLLDEDDAYIISVDNIVVGVIDFNEYANRCYVFFALSKEHRNKGFGNNILRYLPEYAKVYYPTVKEISLYIDKNNKGSNKTAEKAGYLLSGEVGDDLYYKTTITRH